MRFEDKINEIVGLIIQKFEIDDVEVPDSQTIEKRITDRIITYAETNKDPFYESSNEIDFLDANFDIPEEFYFNAYGRGAEIAIIKLLAGQASFTEGEIKILQKNFYMQPIFDIVTFQHDVSEKADHKLLRNLYENGRKTSEDLIAHFKKLGIADKHHLLKIWMDVINMFGIAELEITNLDEKSGKVSIRAKKSSFAKEYISRYGKQKEPVDFILDGAIAGFFSKYLNKAIECKEINCVAKGALYCQFTGR